MTIGCGKLIIKEGQGSQICGWKTGINRDTGFILCDDCKKKEQKKGDEKGAVS